MRESRCKADTRADRCLRMRYAYPLHVKVTLRMA